MKSTTTIINRARVIFGIFASKFTKFETVRKLALNPRFLPKRGGFGNPSKKTWAVRLMPLH
jgi:hypothetical protein